MSFGTKIKHQIFDSIHNELYIKRIINVKQEVQIAKQKQKKRPKKKSKFSIPFDVALLVVFGTLIFILLVLTNRVCSPKEDLNIPDISINFKHYYEQTNTEGLTL
ncbi:MAG: hypothetical protein JXR87_00400 [Candidatus Marinimicrobia bacterium]|nr:hypothetical protein [Candidatus Neomarinimicrobiota bacterium]